MSRLLDSLTDAERAEFVEDVIELTHARSNFAAAARNSVQWEHSLREYVDRSESLISVISRLIQEQPE